MTECLESKGGLSTGDAMVVNPNITELFHTMDKNYRKCIRKEMKKLEKKGRMDLASKLDKYLLQIEILLGSCEKHIGFGKTEERLQVILRKIDSALLENENLIKK